MIAPAADAHAGLMDAVYRRQRHIYDFTRKFYLLGRDRLVENLQLSQGGTVLEIGCGTGRNLALVRRRWPKTELFGLDISAEMLKSARARLGSGVVLALGDAGDFDARHVFGRPDFDRVILSYCTSMIPCWEEAIAIACDLVKRGGSVHIVDFGTMHKLPGWFARAMQTWLTHFHVTPRTMLGPRALTIGGSSGLAGDAWSGLGGYYQAVVLRRPGGETNFHAPAQAVVTQL